MGRQGIRSGRLLSCAALALLGSGCAGPIRHLDPEDAGTWTLLNERAGRHDAVELRLKGEEGRAAGDVRFAADTTRWRDPVSGDERLAPTADVARITFRSRRIGAVQGARAGLVGGLVVTVVATVLIARAEPEVSGSGLAATLLLLTPAAAAIGGGVGAAMDGREDYLLGPPGPPDRRYLPGSGVSPPGYIRPGEEREGEAEVDP